MDGFDGGTLEFTGVAHCRACNAAHAHSHLSASSPCQRAHAHFLPLSARAARALTVCQALKPPLAPLGARRARAHGMPSIYPAFKHGSVEAEQEHRQEPTRGEQERAPRSLGSFTLPVSQPLPRRAGAAGHDSAQDDRWLTALRPPHAIRGAGWSHFSGLRPGGAAGRLWIEPEAWDSTS